MDAFAKSTDDRRLARFILKNLCNVIQPELTPMDCSLYLRKDPQQHEFIRGDMKHHAYSSKDFGGALMKDVVEKIVVDSNMATPTDMFELLVADCIIAHDLRIVDVFEKVWKRKYDLGEIEEE